MSILVLFKQARSSQLIINVTDLNILKVSCLPLSSSNSEVKNSVLHLSRVPIITARFRVGEANVILSVLRSSRTRGLESHSIFVCRHCSFGKNSSSHYLVVTSLMLLTSVWIIRHVFGGAQFSWNKLSAVVSHSQDTFVRPPAIICWAYSLMA